MPQPHGRRRDLPLVPAGIGSLPFGASYPAPGGFAAPLRGVGRGGPAAFCLGTKCARCPVKRPLSRRRGGGGKPPVRSVPPRPGSARRSLPGRGAAAFVCSEAFLLVRRLRCHRCGVGAACRGCRSRSPSRCHSGGSISPTLVLSTKFWGRLFAVLPLPLPLSTQWIFFFFFFFILAEGWGKRKKKQNKTSSFVGCRKASWDSWPARAGKRESGRGETNLCPACLARGLRAPNGHLRAPSPSDPISHWRCGNWEGSGSGVQGTAMRASPSAVRPAGLSLCPAARGRRAGWRANNQLVPMAQRLFSASQVCKTVREQTHCPGRSGPVPGGLLWGLAGTAQHFWGWP